MKNNGLNIKIEGNELIVKGYKSDLIEFSNYIKEIADSVNDKDHLHIDELTLISKESDIKSLIIEKDNK